MNSLAAACLPAVFPQSYKLYIDMGNNIMYLINPGTQGSYVTCLGAAARSRESLGSLPRMTHEFPRGRVSPCSLPAELQIVH